MKVLDKGFLEVIESLGTDLTVVNSARVSFGHHKEVLDKSDLDLIKFLAENKHYSPFRHMIVQFHIKAPEFCMRQIYKHIVGIETTSSSSTKDHAWNEISGRYVPVKEFYIPKVWRAQSEDNKQVSEGKVSEDIQSNAHVVYNDLLKKIQRAYKIFIDSGIAKEQARIVLPLSQYTEVYWTASFQAIMNFIELRDDDQAQWEIREYAKIMRMLVSEIYPETSRIWWEVHNVRRDPS